VKYEEQLLQRILQLESETQSLRNKVESLELHQVKLEASLVISQGVNSVFEEKLDDLQQYSKRSCLIFDNMPVETNEMEEIVKEKISNVVANDLHLPSTEIDKAHRIGPVKDGKQSIIAKFKGHGFTEVCQYKSSEDQAVADQKKTINSSRSKERNWSGSHSQLCFMLTW